MMLEIGKKIYQLLKKIYLHKYLDFLHKQMLKLVTAT